MTDSALRNREVNDVKSGDFRGRSEYVLRPKRARMAHRLPLGVPALRAGKEVTGAFYFTAAPPPGDRAQIDRYRRFRTALTYMGYSVIDKEVHVITDKTTGLTKMKGNLDVEMAFKMLTTATQFDEAVLLGVDVDFLPIVRHLQNLGKTVTCVGRRQMTSTEIINTAKFTDLEDLRGLIERRPG